MRETTAFASWFAAHDATFFFGDSTVSVTSGFWPFFDRLAEVGFVELPDQTVREGYTRLPLERVVNAADVGLRPPHVAPRAVDVRDLERPPRDPLEQGDRLEQRCLVAPADVVERSGRRTIHRRDRGGDDVRDLGEAARLL